jgi:hypothetical protein
MNDAIAKQNRRKRITGRVQETVWEIKSGSDAGNQ